MEWMPAAVIVILLTIAAAHLRGYTQGLKDGQEIADRYPAPPMNEEG